MKSLFYKNNECLRNYGIKFSYTPEQINEIRKCKTDKEYFIKKYCHIINQDAGLIKFNLYKYQKRLLKKITSSKRLIIKAPRQSGKTITMAADILHYVLFNDNKTVAIVAHKASAAKYVLSQIKLMYEHLPYWMQQGVKTWNKKNIKLENNNEIITGATTSSSIRGRAISYLYLDEFAFVSSTLFDEFFKSVYPTVASAKSAKIIMSSTPNGLNHFYKFWTEAVEKINGFKYFAVKWNDIPGRNAAWRKKTINETGLEEFRQEFETEFLGSSNTLICAETLRALAFKNPIFKQFDGKLKIYEEPKIDEVIENGRVVKRIPHIYVAICDVAEGVGEDASTIQIIDVTHLPYSLAATYEDDKMPTNIYHTIIDTLAKRYNNAVVIIENNAIGSEVNTMLFEDTEYENIFFDKKKNGLRMTKQTKKIGCAKLKVMLENDQLIIHDFDTIRQLSKFIKVRQTFKGEAGSHDDLVTPLILFAYFMGNKLWVERWLDIENIHKLMFKQKLAEIESEDLPFGFFNDGIDAVEISPTRKTVFDDW
jgi:hypothetical protein